MSNIPFRVSFLDKYMPEKNKAKSPLDRALSEIYSLKQLENIPESPLQPQQETNALPLNDSPEVFRDNFIASQMPKNVQEEMSPFEQYQQNFLASQMPKKVEEPKDFQTKLTDLIGERSKDYVNDLYSKKPKSPSTVLSYLTDIGDAFTGKNKGQSSNDILAALGAALNGAMPLLNSSQGQAIMGLVNATQPEIRDQYLSRAANLHNTEQNQLLQQENAISDDKLQLLKEYFSRKENEFNKSNQQRYEITDVFDPETGTFVKARVDKVTGQIEPTEYVAAQRQTKESQDAAMKNALERNKISRERLAQDAKQFERSLGVKYSELGLEGARLNKAINMDMSVKMGDDFRADPEIRRYREMLNSGDRLSAILEQENPVIDNAVGTIFIKMLGEVGNLTENEQNKHTSKAAVARLNQALEQAKNGKLTPENRAFIKSAAQALRNGASRSLQKEAQKLADSYKSAGVNASLVDSTRDSLLGVKINQSGQNNKNYEKKSQKGSEKTQNEPIVIKYDKYGKRVK